MSEQTTQLDSGRLLEDWGDIIDPNEFMHDTDGFGLGPAITYYSTLRDRSDGRFLPVYQNEMDLRHIRAMSWLLSERVPMAQAWVNRLQDYTIGTGFDWTISHSNPQLQEECRKTIEDATDNSKWSSDLERESYAREIIDGEWIAELRVEGGLAAGHDERAHASAGEVLDPAQDVPAVEAAPVAGLPADAAVLVERRG